MTPIPFSRSSTKCATWGCASRSTISAPAIRRSAYLSRFRPNKVKIDQSFVRDMDKNGTSLAIIKAVKAIVSELGIDMLVEGVETMEQFEILRANGADEAQGYLFSKPRPASEIARLVADPAQLVRGRNLITEAAAPWAKSFERVNPSMAQKRELTAAAEKGGENGLDSCFNAFS